MIGGVLDLSLVTSTRFVTTAIASEHHYLLLRINGLGSGRWRHPEAIVCHACLLIVAVGSALLECSVLLCGLCSIHSRSCVLGRPLSRILLALLITTSAAMRLSLLRATIFRADMIRCSCRFVKVSVRDLLLELIIFSTIHVVIPSTIGRKALILLILTRHRLLKGAVTPCNGLPWTVKSVWVAHLLRLFSPMGRFYWTYEDLLRIACKSPGRFFGWRVGGGRCL